MRPFVRTSVHTCVVRPFVRSFIRMYVTASQCRRQEDKEFQIRTFGWMLLGGWLGMIIYMTRDFLFPSISKIVRNEDLETKKDEVKNREEGLRKLSHCFTPVRSDNLYPSITTKNQTPKSSNMSSNEMLNKELIRMVSFEEPPNESDYILIETDNYGVFV
uniref:Uncharacterized protein n=1 Tax=Acrobeloides nanus TaxID=290746 RepID=A0A914EP62_9BILA